MVSRMKGRMSSITSKLSIILGMGMLVLAAGCSDARKSSTQFDPDTGSHGTTWLPAGHAQVVTTGTMAGLATASCTACHGADLNGGISGVSCTACHLGGPFAVHPPNWTRIYPDHGPSVNANGTTACSNQYCHGRSLAGVQSSGPSCTTCHSLPFTQDSLVCIRCHQLPPDGTAFPNTAGAHAQHTTLGAYIVCNTCHLGAGGSSANSYHLNGVPVVFFQTTYNAQTGGTATFNADDRTCSNVSCHGGQTTPSWQTGAIDVSTQCTACHTYYYGSSPQYNSYSSGQHYTHVLDWSGPKLYCTVCHDASLLSSNHLTTLNTTSMEGPASATLRAQTLYNGSTCDMNAPGGLEGCHGRDSHSW
jgi:predicted CxxxxCH...CXXCH cytochrome family protein